MLLFRRGLNGAKKNSVMHAQSVYDETGGAGEALVRCRSIITRFCGGGGGGGDR